MKKIILLLFLFAPCYSYSQTSVLVNKVTSGDIYSRKVGDVKNKQINSVDYEFILSTDIKQLTIVDRSSGTSTVLDFVIEQKLGDDNYQVYQMRDNGGTVKFCFKLMSGHILMITYPSFDIFRLSDFEIN